MGGCIAETSLFREKRPWFRKAFPWFMKYVTKAYVSEEEAGQRIAQVIIDDRTRCRGSTGAGQERTGRAGPAARSTRMSRVVLWGTSPYQRSFGSCPSKWSDSRMRTCTRRARWRASCEVVNSIKGSG